MAFDPWVEEQAKRSLEFARKHDIKMNLPSDVVSAIRKGKTSRSKNLKFEVDSTFYILIKKNIDEKMPKNIANIIIYKDLDSATQAVFEYIIDGYSTDNLDLRKIHVENNGT